LLLCIQLSCSKKHRREPIRTTAEGKKKNGCAISKPCVLHLTNEIDKLIVMYQLSESDKKYVFILTVLSVKVVDYLVLNIN
jgi:hypothetical protein